MAAMRRPLPALAGLAVLAAVWAEVAGHRVFIRLIRPGGYLDYIDMTITGRHHDIAASP